MKRWTPEEWNAFVRGPLSNAITESANRAALIAGSFEMMNGMSMRIEAKKIIDTGATLMSVNYNITRVTADGGEAEAGPGTHYAVYHEYGTEKLAARPFMRPTVDEDKDRIVMAAAAAYRDAIRSIF